MKIKDILKKTIVRDIVTNLIYSILIIIYFITLNTQGNVLNQNVLIKYINISSLTFLAISITMFEIGYRKEISKIFINGIEFLILAIFTLLIRHIPKIFECDMRTYTEIGTYAFVAYYIIKSGIMYTKKRYNDLKNLSDIKEIVKEEPTKKVAKRKNIKVKEGN